MNDLSEWIWYTNVDQSRALRLHGRQISLEALSAFIRNQVQRKDEHALLAIFHEDFHGYEEPEHVQEVWTTQSRICRRLAPTEKWC